jgi:hypothetical protein
MRVRGTGPLTCAAAAGLLGLHNAGQTVYQYNKDYSDAMSDSGVSDGSDGTGEPSCKDNSNKFQYNTMKNLAQFLQPNPVHDLALFAFCAATWFETP